MSCSAPSKGLRLVYAHGEKLGHPPWSWSTAERAELLRAVEVFRAAGLPVALEVGETDEGDPWAVIVGPQREEVLLHIARIDGVVILVSEPLSQASRGATLREALRRFLDQDQVRCRLSALALLGADRDRTVLLHPLAMLLAIVALALLVTGEAEARLSDDIDACDVHIPPGWPSDPTPRRTPPEVSSAASGWTPAGQDMFAGRAQIGLLIIALGAALAPDRGVEAAAVPASAPPVEAADTVQSLLAAAAFGVDGFDGDRLAVQPSTSERAVRETALVTWSENANSALPLARAPAEQSLFPPQALPTTDEATPLAKPHLQQAEEAVVASESISPFPSEPHPFAPAGAAAVVPVEILSPVVRALIEQLQNELAYANQAETWSAARDSYNSARGTGSVLRVDFSRRLDDVARLAEDVRQLLLWLEDERNHIDVKDSDQVGVRAVLEYFVPNSHRLEKAILIEDGETTITPMRLTADIILLSVDVIGGDPFPRGDADLPITMVIGVPQFGDLSAVGWLSV